MLRWLKLVPTHLELQVRRLQWWQTILMDRDGSEALLHLLLQTWGRRWKMVSVDAAAVGRLPLGIELGRELIQAWQGNMRKLVMDEECRALFCDIDLDELHMRALYDADCAVWQLAHLRDHAEIETARSFKCSTPLAT